MRVESERGELRRIAARLNELADSIEANEIKPDRWISTNIAADRAGVCYETVYLWCRKFGIGTKTPSGRWLISDRRLNEFLRGRASDPA